MKNIIYKDYLIEKLKDYRYAAEYLKACLEESEESGNIEILMSAVEDVVESLLKK